MMEFLVIGKTELSKDDLKSKLQSLGGKLTSKMHKNLAAVISTAKEVERLSSKMQTAMDMGIQVMTEDFLEKVATGGAIEYIKTNSICDWGTDVSICCDRVALILKLCTTFTATTKNSSRRNEQIQIDEFLHQVCSEVCYAQAEK